MTLLRNRLKKNPVTRHITRIPTKTPPTIPRIVPVPRPEDGAAVCDTDAPTAVAEDESDEDDMVGVATFELDVVCGICGMILAADCNRNISDRTHKLRDIKRTDGVDEVRVVEEDVEVNKLELDVEEEDVVVLVEVVEEEEGDEVEDEPITGILGMTGGVMVGLSEVGRALSVGVAAAIAVIL